jgi:hypothetical protein
VEKVLKDEKIKEKKKQRNQNRKKQLKDYAKNGFIKVKNIFTIGL